MINLYESDEMRRVTGDTIRPGGRELTERAARFCRLRRGAVVLDVGCGIGATAAHLSSVHGLKAVGLDISPMLLARTREKNPDLSLIRGSADALPTGDGAFQALFCECVLSLTPEPSVVLREFHRTLAPGGILILSDIYQRVPAAGAIPAAGVRCCLNGAVSRETVQSMVRRAGFNIFLWEDHTPMLKRLAAEIVFAYGSMSAFWSALGREPGAAACAPGAMKPGYYLLAAIKPV